MSSKISYMLINSQHNTKVSLFLPKIMMQMLSAPTVMMSTCCADVFCSVTTLLMDFYAKVMAPGLHIFCALTPGRLWLCVFTP